jgi:hypothetical protein
MLHARPDYNRIQDPAFLIPNDEPVFLIRGQDKLGPDTVLYWAEGNEAIGGDPELTLLARRHAGLMNRWPVKKRADLVPGQTVSESITPRENITTVKLTLMLIVEALKQSAADGKASVTINQDGLSVVRLEGRAEVDLTIEQFAERIIHGMK